MEPRRVARSKPYNVVHAFMQDFEAKGAVMSALMEGPCRRTDLASRKDVRALLRQVSTGSAALLLAAVDDWNAVVERHSAALRTAIHPLLRGSFVAATTASSVAVWLNTPGMHPPGHLVIRPYQWPAVSSRGETHLVIHHNQVEPTNPRRTAFVNQEPATLGLVGDPTLCELTWEYDAVTDSYVKAIWVSAPGVGWDPIEVPMARAQAQLSAWRKRRVRWLPGTDLPTAAAVESLPARDGAERVRPDVDVRPRPGGGTREAQ